MQLIYFSFKITGTLLFFYLATSFYSCYESNEKKQTTSTDIDSSALYKKYDLDKIKLPPGFSISVYAEVPEARSLALSPGGIVYVGNRDSDKVYAVVDKNKDGKADKVYTIASGLNSPNGVAFKDGSLFIATISSILRLDSIESRLADPPKPVIVYDKYPTDEHHGWKFISFGPDGKLYVPVGAPCNVCEKDNSIYSSITRMNADGSEYGDLCKRSTEFGWICMASDK